jgi:hypothetical protein
MWAQRLFEAIWGFLVLGFRREREREERKRREELKRVFFFLFPRDFGVWVEIEIMHQKDS